MSQKQAPALFNLTSPAQLLFENLFEAKAIGEKGKEQGAPKFDINLGLLPDHPDIPGLKALVIQTALARWPGRDIGAELKAGTFKLPLTDGNKLADSVKRKAMNKGSTEEQAEDKVKIYRGKLVITSRSKYEPNLAAVLNGKAVDFDGDKRGAAKTYFYRGVHCLAQFNFSAYEGVGANPDGVTAYLQTVMSLNTGERLSQKASAAEVFKGYVGVASNFDPTGGAPAEIEF